jgi:uncharacterized protein involved in exopolysaccharide biosynthesis
MTPRPADLKSPHSAALVSAAHDRSKTVLDVRELFLVLRRQIKLILALLLLGLTAAFVFLHLVQPRYTATVSLAIDTRGQRILDASEVIPNLGSETEPIESQAEILRSRRIVERLLSNGSQPVDEKALQDLMRRIKVERKGLSTVVNVTVSDLDPREAARLANAVADGFLADQVAVKQATIRQATKWLIKRVNELGPELRSAEKRLLEVRQGNREAPTSSGETPSLAELEAVVQADRELYTSLLRRSQETLLLEGMQVPDARIVAYASPPSDPSYPVWSLTLGLAGLASLLLGGAIAVLRESLAGT